MVQLFHRYFPVKAVIFVASEVLLTAVALMCAIELRFWGNPAAIRHYVHWPDFAYQFGVFAVVVQISLYFSNLYDLRAVRTAARRLLTLGQSLGTACVLLGIVYMLQPDLFLGRGVLFITVGLMSIFVLVSRIVVDRAWGIATIPRNVLILGTGQFAVTVAREIKVRDDLDLNILGFVGAPSDQEKHGGVLFGRPVLGVEDDLERVVEFHRVDQIIVAQEDRRSKLPMDQLVRLKVSGVAITEASSWLSALTGRIWLDRVQPSFFVFSDGFRRSRLMLMLKRLSDICLSLSLGIVAIPCAAVIALVIRFDSPGAVLYRQKRVGRGGKVFNLLKFRSMRMDAERDQMPRWASKNDPRLTRIGKFIRTYRIDELPQLINILRGDMSFVGPRPERPEFVSELAKTIPCYSERHSVRPGLTGWAQVQFRYANSMEDTFRKLEYDLFYMQHMGFFFDLLIVWKTVGTVLSGAGAH